ncbi:BglG family transcription antiterminator [Enterococcus sp. LJL120]
MNERIRTILTLLIKNPNLKIGQLTEELGLTKRQINYSINQFNQELELQGLPIIERNHVGDFLIPLAILKNFDSLAGQQQVTATILTENERSALVLFTLIANTDYVSLQHVIEYLEVSKNTASEDIKKAGWLAEKYQLTIQYDRINGYQLKGSEHRILQLLSDLVKHYNFIQKEEYRDQFQLSITENEVIHLIHGMEQLLHLSYSDESIDYLQATLRFLLHRGINSPTKTNFFEGNVKDTPEYKLLLILLSEFEWRLATDYLEWLTLLFLSSNIFEKKTTQEYDSDIKLKGLIAAMVSKFEEQTLIVIEERQDFQRRILSHLRPACFRISYNLSLGAYSLDNLVQESSHGILVELMKELITPIEDWLGKAFPNDELELLSYYFGYQLANDNNLVKQKPRAVVVCRNGVMVSKLMRENLKSLFPEIHFIASLSVRDFYQFQKDADLVFSTTPLDSGLIQFIINPLMTYKEQINLRYRVLNELGFNEIDQAIEDVTKIIQKYAKVTDLVMLKEELQMFLIKNSHETSLESYDVLPSLLHYLQPSAVKLVSEELTWQSAVELACQPLLDKQIITADFVADCIRQIAETGYAGYLGTEMCIPHTTVEHGVLRDGVSFLVSQKAVVFPNGRRLHLIAPLAFFDLTKHLRAINQLAQIADNQELIQAILTARDEKTIYQLIRQIT